MDRHRIDTLVYPVKSLSAPPIGTSDRDILDNPISAVTGLPAIVVPAGADEAGFPLAIEFLGHPFSEARLLQLVRAYEQASRKRIAPKIATHLPGEVFSY